MVPLQTEEIVVVYSSEAAASSKAQLRKLIKNQMVQVYGRSQPFAASDLRQFLHIRKGTWAAFQPLTPEPPVLDIVKSETHLDWVFPRVAGDQLVFHRPDENGWKVGPLGVLEPLESLPQVPQGEIEGALVPGIAFTRTGQRLGRGKGFYDRFLRAWHGLAVGVCWSEALVEEIPQEPHDVGVAWVATESELIPAPGVQRKD
jgi:5-formyltetrahydrofolate cyclo-ligase